MDLVEQCVNLTVNGDDFRLTYDCNCNINLDLVNELFCKWKDLEESISKEICIDRIGDSFASICHRQMSSLTIPFLNDLKLMMLKIILTFYPYNKTSKALIPVFFKLKINLFS